MSYPPERYTAEQGAPSAQLRPAHQEPDLRIGDRVTAHYLATGASTGGDYGLYRWEMGPQPAGASAHFHRTMSEAFYVLDGAVQLFDGEHWTEGTPGDFLYVPPGGVHAFRNESGAPASMLILFAPGGPREAYFEALAAITAEGRMLSPAEWEDLYAQHDQYVV